MDDWKWLAVDAKLWLWTGQDGYDSLILVITVASLLLILL
jgi:hypothetical protein